VPCPGEQCEAEKCGEHREAPRRIIASLSLCWWVVRFRPGTIEYDRSDAIGGEPAERVRRTTQTPLRMTPGGGARLEEALAG
jgi:hypothetical protein